MDYYIWLALFLAGLLVAMAAGYIWGRCAGSEIRRADIDEMYVKQKA